MSTKQNAAKQNIAMVTGAETGPAFPAHARAAFRSLRPHQWTKNALIFLPLILAHRLGDLVLVGQSVLAFLAFSLAASGVYLVNDMMDVSQDRKHPVKRNRPIASGQLPMNAARLLSGLCFVTAGLMASRLPAGFALVLAGYLALNLAYTFYLKRKLLVDVLALAGAYTLRIMAGAVASGIDQSFWLLTFASFLFLSLALVKRYIELDTVGDGDSPDKKRVMGRGYRVADLDMLSQLGVASAFSAVLVLALYVDGQGRMGLYRTPEFIWLVCPVVLYVIGRIWVLAKRRELPDDPVLFIIKDWRSHLMGAFVVAIIFAARHIG
jgi:4-hydroxybenzoate polyprenyltransferase